MQNAMITMTTITATIMIAGNEAVVTEESRFSMFSCLLNVTEIKITISTQLPQ